MVPIAERREEPERYPTLSRLATALSLVAASAREPLGLSPPCRRAGHGPNRRRGLASGWAPCRRAGRGLHRRRELASGWAPCRRAGRGLHRRRERASGWAPCRRAGRGPHRRRELASGWAPCRRAGHARHRKGRCELREDECCWGEALFAVTFHFACYAVVLKAVPRTLVCPDTCSLSNIYRSIDVI